MADRLEADAVVVGGGTSGSYFAWKLAGDGYDCLVLEKENLDKLGTHIGPFHVEEEAFAEFGLPLPKGEEYLHTARTTTLWSPDLRYRVTAPLITMVMDKPRFMRRLRSYAEEAGVRFLEGVEFTDLIFERGFPCGVRARSLDGELEVRARLVVDASGIDGVVRTRMPSSPWFENDPVADLDTLIVYMESWKDIQGEINPDVNSFLHCQGWYAPGAGEEIIVGVGMPASPDGARNRQKAFAATLPFEGEMVTSTGGRVPYRRPPYSLVDNAVMVMGDAAFMNKPFSGEGVVSAFTACRIAAEVAAEALASDDLSREALWRYNVRYFRDQGAKFAFLMAVIPSLAALGEDEINYLFMVPGLLTEEGTLSLQLEYEVAADHASALRAVPVLAKGLRAGELGMKSLASVGGMGIAAAALKGFYSRYPDCSADFGGWKKKVTRLWRMVDSSRHGYMYELVRRWS